jgi:hypothetical protein
MKLIPFEYTTENADACARGTMTMYRAGQTVTRKLTRAEMRLYEAAKEQHYVIARGRSGLDVSNAYYLWCEGAQIPFIRIEQKRNYSYLTLDVIFLPRERYLHPDAIRELDLLFRRHAKPPCWYGSGDNHCSCSRIPNEAAERVAATMWSIATASRPLPTEPSSPLS